MEGRFVRGCRWAQGPGACSSFGGPRGLLQAPRHDSARLGMGNCCILLLSTPWLCLPNPWRLHEELSGQAVADDEPGTCSRAFRNLVM